MPAGPWSGPNAVTVSGQDANLLVDPAPIVMPDGSVLLYYLMDYTTSGDPATSQPGSVYKFGVARSTSTTTFTHQGVAYTQNSSMADPFPMMLANGTIRLLFWAPASPGSMFSVTATDTTGLRFGTIDAGSRAPTSGAPGALVIGSTYYIYAGGNYYTSSDGLNFTLGGGSGVVDHAIAAGDGTYVSAYIYAAALPLSQRTCISTSPDGKSWTKVAEVGAGGVPGIVKFGGAYHVYALAPR